MGDPIVSLFAVDMVVPTGFEPRVTGVRGQCPRPLDDGTNSRYNTLIGWLCQ